MVVEPVEELELIETQQHLCYIFIYACHVCGKARLASVASSLASSLRGTGSLASLCQSSESKPSESSGPFRHLARHVKVGHHAQHGLDEDP